MLKFSLLKLKDSRAELQAAIIHGYKSKFKLKETRKSLMDNINYQGHIATPLCIKTLVADIKNLMQFFPV